MYNVNLDSLYITLCIHICIYLILDHWLLSHSLLKLYKKILFVICIIINVKDTFQQSYIASTCLVF